MYFTKHYSRQTDDGNWAQTQYQCPRCKKPAICLMADCGGDCIIFCQEHWLEWISDELKEGIKTLENN